MKLKNFENKKKIAEKIAKEVKVPYNYYGDEREGRICEKRTEEDVKKMAKKALKAMGHTDTCPHCGADMWGAMFWFRDHGKPVRNCPECNGLVEE